MYQAIVFLPLIGALIAGLLGTKVFRQLGRDADVYGEHHAEAHDDHAHDAHGHDDDGLEGRESAGQKPCRAHDLAGFRYLRAEEERFVGPALFAEPVLFAVG